MDNPDVDVWSSRYVIQKRYSEILNQKVEEGDVDDFRAMWSYYSDEIDKEVKTSIKNELLNKYDYGDVQKPIQIQKPEEGEKSEAMLKVAKILTLRASFVSFDVIKSAAFN